MSKNLTLQDLSISLMMPNRLVRPSPWVEHIPFAFYIIKLLKPNVLVELGTHKGNSYCAFCQAVSRLNLSTKCYAVDTWEGDEHGGFYGPNIFLDLKKHHDPLYGRFSRLLKMTFDDALRYFSDGTIDLLHIDGLHTYEAVKHDYENWVPKLSNTGVVIFHDTNVRERDFGVWRFWEEIKQYHTHLEFFHGNGLGVLIVGEDNTIKEQINEIENSYITKKYFATIGANLEFILQIQHLKTNLSEQEQSIQMLKLQLKEKEQEVKYYAQSKSWLITSPMRKFSNFIKNLSGSNKK